MEKLKRYDVILLLDPKTVSENPAGVERKRLPAPVALCAERRRECGLDRGFRL